MIIWQSRTNGGIISLNRGKCFREKHLPSKVYSLIGLSLPPTIPKNNFSVNLKIYTSKTLSIVCPYIPFKKKKFA